MSACLLSAYLPLNPPAPPCLVLIRPLGTFSELAHTSRSFLPVDNTCRQCEYYSVVLLHTHSADRGFVTAWTIGIVIYMSWRGRFPRVFGDEFGDEFGDSLNFASKLVTHLVMISVNHCIW